MTKHPYVVVGNFRNDLQTEIRLSLEMLGEVIVMSPGHEIELLAYPSEGLLPLTIDFVKNGIQIHPNKEADPQWHVIFKGKLIRAEHPTRLSDYE